MSYLTNLANVLHFPSQIVWWIVSLYTPTNIFNEYVKTAFSDKAEETFRI